MKIKKIIGILMLVLVMVSVGLLSGCISASYTVHGKITRIEHYINQNDVNGNDITIIYFGNGSGWEVTTSSVKRYNLQVCDKVVLELDLGGIPYRVKNMYYFYDGESC
jgi:hypothetical protein